MEGSGSDGSSLQEEHPEDGLSSHGSHLHSMPFCRHGSPHESEAAYFSMASPELHHGLVHGQTVVDLVWIKREDWVHG